MSLCATICHTNQGHTDSLRLMCNCKYYKQAIGLFTRDPAVQCKTPRFSPEPWMRRTNKVSRGSWPEGQACCRSALSASCMCALSWSTRTFTTHRCVTRHRSPSISFSRSCFLCHEHATSTTTRSGAIMHEPVARRKAASRHRAIRARQSTAQILRQILSACIAPRRWPGACSALRQLTAAPFEL